MRGRIGPYRGYQQVSIWIDLRLPRGSVAARLRRLFRKGVPSDAEEPVLLLVNRQGSGLFVTVRPNNNG